MTKYREILRLSALGLTLREIAASLQVSQHTIEYSGLRVPPIRDRIPANRAMIPLCFQ